MFSLTEFEGIYLHRGYVDMRKSIGGLSVVVESQMKLSLFGKNLFVFCNRRRNLVKVLYWDRSGFALWMKRLEEQRFYWPLKLSQEEVIDLTSEQVRWLLDGLDLSKIVPHRALEYESVL